MKRNRPRHTTSNTHGEQNNSGTPQIHIVHTETSISEQNVSTSFCSHLMGALQGLYLRKSACALQRLPFLCAHSVWVNVKLPLVRVRQLVSASFLRRVGACASNLVPNIWTGSNVTHVRRNNFLHFRSFMTGCCRHRHPSRQWASRTQPSSPASRTCLPKS